MERTLGQAKNELSHMILEYFFLLELSEVYHKIWPIVSTHPILPIIGMAREVSHRLKAACDGQYFGCKITHVTELPP